MRVVFEIEIDKELRAKVLDHLNCKYACDGTKWTQEIINSHIADAVELGEYYEVVAGNARLKQIAFVCKVADQPNAVLLEYPKTSEPIFSDD